MNLPCQSYLSSIAVVSFPIYCPQAWWGWECCQELVFIRGFSISDWLKFPSQFFVTRSHWPKMEVMWWYISTIKYIIVKISTEKGIARHSSAYSCLGRDGENSGWFHMFCKEEIAKLLPKTQQAKIPPNTLKLLFEEYLLYKISLYNQKLLRNRQRSWTGFSLIFKV